MVSRSQTALEENTRAMAQRRRLSLFTPHRAKGEHMYSTPIISGERLYTGDRAGSMPTAEGAMVSSAGRKVWPSARHPPKGEVPDAVWLRARGRGRPA